MERLKRQVQTKTIVEGQQQFFYWNGMEYTGSYIQATASLHSHVVKPAYLERIHDGIERTNSTQKRHKQFKPETLLLQSSILVDDLFYILCIGKLYD